MIALDVKPGTKVWLRVPGYITISEAEVLSIAGSKIACQYPGYDGKPVINVVEPARLYVSEIEAVADAILEGMEAVYSSIDSLQSLRNRLAGLRSALAAKERA